MTCLGDLFSVGWMEFLENNENALEKVTFEQMYQNIHERAIDRMQV